MRLAVVSDIHGNLAALEAVGADGQLAMTRERPDWACALRAGYVR
jgi:hypothetical protein